MWEWGEKIWSFHLMLFPSRNVLSSKNFSAFLWEGKLTSSGVFLFVFIGVSRSLSAGLCKIHQRKASLDCRSFRREAYD